MRTRAAVVDEGTKEFEVRELEVDEPGAGEVHVRFVASGLCHSDLHLVDGDLKPRYPMVAGHEGAGIVEGVGPGVTKVVVGDHVVCSFVPSCGSCRYCATGRSSVCDLAVNSVIGLFPDGRSRFHRDGRDYGGFCMLGTFSERATVLQHSVVKVDDWLPLETAVLVGCGVPTGWGSVVYSAETRPGDSVVIFGIGGIGINAVQGAKHAGARHIIAVDPVEFKRTKALEFGATHAVATGEEAIGKAYELTNGVGADQAVVTVGVVDSKVVEDAFNATRKLGTTVVVGLGPMTENTIQLNGDILTLYQKTVKGSLFGASNPMYDIKNILSLYRDGLYKLDELVTRTYTLDQVNQGYEDLEAGENLRGVILYDS